jgi:hypothetical protein
MEYTTMALPNPLREEEDELSTERVRATNPWLGLPVPPYIVVARVTTVTTKQMT